LLKARTRAKDRIQANSRTNDSWLKTKTRARYTPSSDRTKCSGLKDQGSDFMVKDMIMNSSHKSVAMTED